MIGFKISVPDTVTKDDITKLLHAQWGDATVEVDSTREPEPPAPPAPAFSSPTEEAAKGDRDYKKRVDEQMQKPPLGGAF